jgi:hypothetical protein
VNALLIMLGTVAVGGLYVFLPMASRFRTKKVVKCPETGQPAEVLVDASPDSSGKRRKRPFSIRNCSLWPKKKGCTQSCLD